MPSLVSTSVFIDFDSSTVMTPSLPTAFIASAISSPIVLSFAEIDATCAIFSVVSTFWTSVSMSETAVSTARSMPRLMSSGFDPAVTLRRPSRMIACARTVAVVVPSPAMSFVFEATSLTSCAPMFSNVSGSSISLAIVTPSLVIVGLPNFLSRTTLRPFGPSVTFTASARVLAPRSSARRAFSSNTSCFAAMIPVLHSGGDARVVDHGEYVLFRDDEVLFAVELDLGPRVLRVNDAVADLHVHRQFGAIVERAAGTDGQNAAFLRLLLRRVGKDDAADALLGLFHVLDDHAIAQWLEIHENHSSESLCCRVGEGLGPLALRSRECQARVKISRLSTRVQEAKSAKCDGYDDGVRRVSRLIVERVARCPFSVAHEYAEDFLRDAERSVEVKVPLRDFIAGLPGAARAPVKMVFALHPDDQESGRLH